MIEGYIPQEQRKKILLLTDDIRLPSGVGNMGKEIVLNTAHRYNWINLGAAVQHPDQGKRFDLSTEVNSMRGIEDAYVHVIPSSGYGDVNTIRTLIKQDKIDAIFLITDPRYFTWLFQIENEVRKKVPIIYLNIWDDYPAPMYNKAFYESCDALLGISKQTVNINKLVLGKKAQSKVIDYVPHGVSTNIYRPINESSPDYTEFKKFKSNVLGNRDMDFVLFFNSRNIRRKSIPDTLLAWKYFIDQLPKEKADKCLFILHTELVSDAGTDLMAVNNYLFGKDYKNIIFSTSKISANQINFFYNMADAQILLTSNEGWGLSLTEAMLTEVPIIANVTGGMQDQMRFEDENSNWINFDADFPSNHTGKYKKCGKWAFPVFPSNRSLVGSPPTPYIWDDRCNPEDATARIMELYNMTREERKALGAEGRKWALSEEAGFTAEIMAQRVIKNVDKTFKNFVPRTNYEFINVTELEEDNLPHKLIY
jgi:glycosyltransferase involved in cell wall biosynthesis